MKNIVCLLFLLFLCWPVQSAKAELFLEDGFESGDRSSPDGLGSWRITDGAVTVSSERPRTGTYSLRMEFIGNPTGDAMAEQRANVPQTNEFWGRVFLYIPVNYFHRSVSPSNNKFWAVYAQPYTSPGFQMNLSLEAGTGGSSNLSIHRYHNGKEVSVLSPYQNFISLSDRGKWIEVVLRVKVPNNLTSNDGIIQVWKNGVKVADYVELNIFGSSGRNYIDGTYLLGWSNSGFAENTVMYIDDVLIGSEKINSIYKLDTIITPPTGLIIVPN